MTMEIKTFKAKTMRDALELVRRELGPAAAVLHTREVHGGPIGRLVFGRRYEVAASTAVNVPSRLPAEVARGADAVPDYAVEVGVNGEFEVGGFGIAAGAKLIDDYRARYRDDFRRQVAGQLDELHA